jgi:hypothetical protein
MTVDDQKILDEIRLKPVKGWQKVHVPRVTRRNIKGRDVTLEIRYASFEIKKPEIKNKDKTLLSSLHINVVYVKEEHPPEGVEPIEWFLMTNEEVTSVEAAYEKVAYYIQRWKIEERQKRTMEKMKTLILMYSVISVFVMNLTYMGRVYPDMLCSQVFDEDEWKLLYC